MGGYGYAGYPYAGAYGYPYAPALVAHPNGAVVPAEPADVVAARADHLAAHGAPVVAPAAPVAPYYAPGFAGLVAHPNGALVPAEPADVCRSPCRTLGCPCLRRESSSLFVLIRTFFDTKVHSAIYPLLFCNIRMINEEVNICTARLKRVLFRYHHSHEILICCVRTQNFMKFLYKNYKVSI